MNCQLLNGEGTVTAMTESTTSPTRWLSKDEQGVWRAYLVATAMLSARLAEDLEADSLALIELVEALEEDLGERTVGFSVDDDDLADLRTVGDAVDYVVLRLGAASA